jgi:hypothetical protein
MGEKHTSRTIQAMKDLFAPMDNKWVDANSLVINYARGSKLVLGGSIAMAVTRKKPHKVPGDLDFFTNSYADAMEFVGKIMTFLSSKKGTYGRINFNNETEYVLEGVKNHIRIEGPKYWLPICVMVLEKEVRSFIWNGIRVQYFDDVVAAAKHTTTRDNKTRVPWEPRNNVTIVPMKQEDIDVALDMLEECGIAQECGIDPLISHKDGVDAFHASVKKMQNDAAWRESLKEEKDQKETNYLFLS